jgi:3alpha(or 20beta)-hydroxysteroid dehydrogenase
MRLKGKVALISGGAEGIGAETARRFVAEGAQVVLGDVQLEKARKLADDLNSVRFERSREAQAPEQADARLSTSLETNGDIAFAVELDVCSLEHWQAAVTVALDRFGKLTTLCNIAGISEPGGVVEVPLDSWARTIDINLNGTFNGCRAALPALVASHEPAAIVNVGSMLALRPGAMFAAYCASKAGVTALTKTIALDCAKKDWKVRANTVHPGAIRTPMFERYLAMAPDRAAAEAMFTASHPLGRVGEAREVADAIVFLASDEASFTTGADLPVDGGGFIRE